MSNHLATVSAAPRSNYDVTPNENIFSKQSPDYDHYFRGSLSGSAIVNELVVVTRTLQTEKSTLNHYMPSPQVKYSFSVVTAAPTKGVWWYDTRIKLSHLSIRPRSVSITTTPIAALKIQQNKPRQFDKSKLLQNPEFTISKF